MAYQLATAFVSVQAKNGLTAAFSQIKSQVGSLLSGIGNISPVLGAVAGFAGLTYAINNAMGAAEEAINAEARLNAIIRATGNAARLSANDVLEMSKNLQSTGIFASTDITKATTALIQMRAITRESFPEIIKLSQDVAAAGFGTVETAARTLGRAMADPARGLFRLRSIGIQFTKAEQDKIRALAATNDLLGAQRIILDKLRNSIGGTTEALAKTPAGQWMQIKHQLADISEELGKHILPIAVRIGREVLRITRIIAPLVNRILDINDQLGGWPVKIALAAIAMNLLTKGALKASSAFTELFSSGSALGAFITNPWVAGTLAVIAGLVAEYSAIWWYLNKFPKFTEAWNNFTLATWVAMKQVWTATKETFGAYWKIIKLLMPEWMKQLPIIKQLLEQGILAAIIKIMQMTTKGITVIGAFIKTLGDIGSNTIGLIVDDVNKIYNISMRVDGVFESWAMHLRSVASSLLAIAGLSAAIKSSGFRGLNQGKVGDVGGGILKGLGLDRFAAGIKAFGKAVNPDWFRKLYNENLRNAKLDIELAKLAAKRKEQAAKGGAGGPSGLNGGVLDIAPGLSGLQDAWKNVQEALLKKESPMERAANGIESLDGTADRMLEELTMLNSKFNGNGPVVAGV